MKQPKGRKGVGGAPSVYQDSFKIAVASEYLEGKLSYKQLAEKYQLPGGATAQHFVRWYRRWLADQDNSVPKSTVAADQSTLELKQQLKQANLRITALEMLIKNAEEELGIDIVKKSGTKQQGK